MQIWNSILDLFESALAGLHDLFEPLAGAHAWGFAIIALTLVVRLLLLPLAIKQIRSMRAMQAVQPQLKEIQKKYKVDRELMRKDPEQYRAKKQKLQQEQMELFQREGVNPAASCLPLLAQAPIFFALFSILRGERAAELANEPFYFLTRYITEDAEFSGLGALVNQASWPGWLLIVLMAATMFVSQKQTMARQPQNADNPMAQQQKILLYVMPVFLAFISLNLPLGVLLYWVTTNAWQAIQQWFMLREVQHEVEGGTLASRPGGAAAKKTAGRGRKANGAATEAAPRNPGASSGTSKAAGGTGSKGGSKAGGPKSGGSKTGGSKTGGSKTGGSKAAGRGQRSPGAKANSNGSSAPKPGARDHLPRRRGR